MGQAKCSGAEEVRDSVRSALLELHAAAAVCLRRHPHVVQVVVISVILAVMVVVVVVEEEEGEEEDEEEVVVEIRKDNPKSSGRPRCHPPPSPMDEPQPVASPPARVSHAIGAFCGAPFAARHPRVLWRPRACFRWPCF